MRSVPFLGWVVLVAAPVWAPNDAAGQTSPVTSLESIDFGDQEFEPAVDLADALGRATGAIRAAEDRGIDYEDRMAEAQFYLSEALGFDSASARAEYLYGRMNVLIGRTRDAFGQIRAFLKTPEGKNDWEAFKTLGDLHYTGKYYVQAERKYERAIELNPEKASPYEGLCLALLKLGKRQKAIEAGSNAVQRDPRSAIGYEALAQALTMDAQLPEARAAILQAIEISRGRLKESVDNITLLQRIQAHYRVQQTILSAALLRDPRDGPAYREYAKSIRDRADLETMVALHHALNVLKKGITETRPNIPRPLLYEYIEMLLVVHRPDQAMTVLDGVLEVRPEDTTARELRDRVLAAQAAESGVTAADPP
ncbi:MAG: tetratricopeptide repeat protein [Planctomycetes bacterium]|nr:tetratricopeptide repeat protein [Planctomycetota bacterium]